jgi:hypothetical protein
MHDCTAVMGCLNEMRSDSCPEFSQKPIIFTLIRENDG